MDEKPRFSDVLTPWRWKRETWTGIAVFSCVCFLLVVPAIPALVNMLVKDFLHTLSLLRVGW